MVWTPVVLRGKYKLVHHSYYLLPCLFNKWVRRHVEDLYMDLRDGHNLISLLEVLSGETLPREKGHMRFHRLQNCQIALDFLKYKHIKLVNIRNIDIADGNPKLTLGLIWTIILHFQVRGHINMIIWRSHIKGHTYILCQVRSECTGAFLWSWNVRS
ncbi:PREDICTED: plectin-like [Branchiostoma belcheri]|uniref:Plectin-like n=1 Tax=Branchiostoma belcheri TaxID=7741 RepID=A0A6P5A9M3_BRABE|nr:PREDICTED: plectin-like [Branchiostoma belcheri]